ncbi:MAG: thermonuclease family protein [Actinomycetes bacterium]
MRWSWLVAVGLAAGAGVACTAPSPSYDGRRTAVGDPPPPGRAFAARVDRVVDGDTIVATRGGRALRVRLIGVDAPESVQPDMPVECYGRRAARELATLLPAGTRVRAAYQPGGRRDRFGRELWDVWRRDGTFVQAELVRRGGAEARAYPPHTDHAEALDAVEREARAQMVGLWGAC